MSRRILFLDLDGTTLSDDKSMPDENIKAINDVLDAGHIVAINTGRGIHSTMMILDEFGFSHENIYLICFQGNLIYHPADDRILYSDGIARSDGIEILRDLNDHGIHAHTYGDAGIISVLDNDNLREYMRITHEKTVFLSSWENMEESVIPKVIAIDYSDHERLEAYRREFTAASDGRFECFFSSPMYLEFTRRGIDKGVGVREFTRLMGADLSETIGIGDEENDVPMIEASGIGIAVKNAVSPALEAAGYVTERDNNHGAVAEAIKKYL